MSQMSFADLVKAVKGIVPGAIFFEDSNGQLHIATGLQQNGEDNAPLDCVQMDTNMYPFERDTSGIM